MKSIFQLRKSVIPLLVMAAIVFLFPLLALADETLFFCT